MTSSTITLGKLVRERRESRHMSQEKLARQIEVCKRTIIDIETDIGNPKFDVMYRLFRELDIPLEQIFYPDGPENFGDKSMLIQELRGCSEDEISMILPMVVNMKQTLRKHNGRKK